MKRLLLLVVLGILVLSACATQAPAAKVGSIEILNPWVRPAGADENTGAFMVIKNTGDQADKLVKAEFSGGMMTEIHETKMVDNVMKMAPVDGVDIPAKGQAELKPGSFHVMVMGLMKEIKVGDKVEITLTFEKAGTVTVAAEVRNP